MEVNSQTYRNYQLLSILHCVDCNPHDTISNSAAFQLAWIKHHINTMCGRFIGIQDLSLRHDTMYKKMLPNQIRRVRVSQAPMYVCGIQISEFCLC